MAPAAAHQESGRAGAASTSRARASAPLDAWDAPPPDITALRAPAVPAQRFLGGGFGRGAKPPSDKSTWARHHTHASEKNMSGPSGWRKIPTLSENTGAR